MNLEMTLALRKKLERHGVHIGIYRIGDEDSPLSEKIRSCNAFASNAAVEIHKNAGGCKTRHHEGGDPCFAYVTRGVAEHIEWLNIPDNPLDRGWAAKRGHSSRILTLFGEIQGQNLGNGDPESTAVAPRPPDGKTSQKLILPINEAKLTASMKTVSYKKTFGFEHYGVDIVSVTGNRTIYASGRGTVVAVGTDSVVGKVVAVRYTGAINRKTGEVHDVIFRYYHLGGVKAVMGDSINQGTVLGVYGNTGSMKMGLHLHLEADTDTAHPLHSPTVNSSSFLKARSNGANDSTMSSPLEWLHVKTGAPYYQTYTTAGDAYISEGDESLVEIL